MDASDRRGAPRGARPLAMAKMANRLIRHSRNTNPLTLPEPLSQNHLNPELNPNLNPNLNLNFNPNINP